MTITSNFPVNVGGGGGGSAITVIDTPDSHGGIVREVIAVDISQDTVTAAHLETGYTAHDRFGNPVAGALVPGGDSPFVVTVSWNSTSELWEPDCTIYELQDAYDGEEQIIFISENGSSVGWYYDDDYVFVYGVYDSITNGFLLREYWFTTSGISHSGDTPFIFPNFDSPTRSYTPTESQQTDTITYDPNDGYNGIAQVGVTIGAISPTYVGSGITRRNSTDLAANGATVTVPAGYYESQASTAVATMTLPSAPTSSSSGTSKGTISRSTSTRYLNIPTGYNSTAQYYTIEAVANGTAGTPTATKGTVSNHSVSVTPSVTNTTGYITGSTKTGTAVTVTASELASGNKEITSNGNNIDVVGYSTVSVNVPTGSAKNVQAYLGYDSVSTTSYTATDVTITVAKTGTYNVGWMGWRSYNGSNFGSQLYKNGTAVGSASTTFINTYGQSVSLSNQSFNQGDVLVVRARASSTTRYMVVGNLIIEEV